MKATIDYEQFGDVSKGEDIGKTRGHRYQWLPCLDCGKERWVPVRLKPPMAQRCTSCANKPKVRYGVDNHWWKGGRSITKEGYSLITLHPNDFFYPMTNSRRRVFEHRLVMAQHLGRCLHRWEIVHHRNGVRDDNRIENLQLVTDERHKQITMLEMQIKQLKAENQALRKKLKCCR